MLTLISSILKKLRFLNNSLIM